MLAFVAELRDFLMGIFSFIGCVVVSVMTIWFVAHGIGWLLSKWGKERLPDDYWNPFA